MKPLLCLLCVLLLAATCYAAPCGPGCTSCSTVKTLPSLTSPVVVQQGTVTTTTVEATAIVVDRPQPIKRFFRWFHKGKAQLVVVPPDATEFNGTPPLMDNGTLKGNYKEYVTADGTLIFTPIKPDAKPSDFHGGPHPGPMPGPQPFHTDPIPGPGPQPFHGGGGGYGQGWHGGGWGGGFYRAPYYNPMPYVLPFIENYATSPRSIQNPMTLQWQMMTPGQWVQPQPGVYAWQALPVWPLLGDKKPTVSAGVAVSVDVEAIPGVHYFRQHKPIRKFLHRLF